MSIVSKFKSYFALDDEYEYKEEVVEKEVEEPKVVKTSKPAPVNTSNNNIVSLQSVQKSSKVVLLEPRAYADAQEVADHLNNKRAVVVNLQRIQRDQGKRIVDFLSGTVYAINGDIQKIGTDIFLCTPANVDVSGNITGFGFDEEDEETRW
ncbi:MULTISPECIES: cell division protein SepF [Peribacillus]|uniref:Cell division protein SepF n=1 Tax=Peribacillus asahii TaxID=228899 RepID=A0A398BHS3_9BACI|nr:cell division protein SepF [Peribacillus asahii]AZV42185.1 cell division protein SepF [Peribacillus asahii]RID87250.1 cell division protein SepF [Peribacillus asahii]USK61132.1 cell division protein SepF [Peribacillus asahii]USK71564.1 cell division protein SepF [Peribacillus asahii]USK86502.1 cell division protein SepF [Peribacillus asahii]